MAKSVTLSGGPNIFDKIRYDTPGNIWMGLILFELFMIVMVSFMDPLGVLLYVLIHIAISAFILIAGIRGILVMSSKMLVITFLIVMVVTWIGAISIICAI